MIHFVALEHGGETGKRVLNVRNEKHITIYKPYSNHATNNNYLTNPNLSPSPVLGYLKDDSKNKAAGHKINPRSMTVSRTVGSGHDPCIDNDTPSNLSNAKHHTHGTNIYTSSTTLLEVEKADTPKWDPGTSNVSCHRPILDPTGKSLAGRDACSLVESESPGDGHIAVFLGNSSFECNISANSGPSPDCIGKDVSNP